MIMEKGFQTERLIWRSHMTTLKENYKQVTAIPLQNAINGQLPSCSLASLEKFTT